MKFEVQDKFLRIDFARSEQTVSSQREAEISHTQFDKAVNAVSRRSLVARKVRFACFLLMLSFRG